MDRLNLEITWDINNDQLKASMDQSRKSIEGVGQTVEVVEKKVNDNLSNITKATQDRIDSLRTKIAQIQSDIAKWSGPNSTLGISEDNQYFDKYRAQIAALRSEIDNLQNASIVPDDLEKLPEAAENAVNALGGASDETKEAGESAEDALDGLVTKFISWNAIMEVGKELLITYGPMLLKFAIAAIKGKDALEELKKEMEELRAVRLKGAQDAQRELSSLDSLYRATQNQSLALGERKKAVDALQSQYPQYFKNISDEQIMAGKAADSYGKLKDAIIAAARARAYQDKIAELARKRLENEDRIVQLATDSEDANSNYKNEKRQLDKVDPYGNVQGYNIALGRASAAQTAVEVIKQDITELNEANVALDRQMKRYQNSIDGLVKSDGVEILIGNRGSEAVAKSAEDALASILDGRRNALQKIDELNREFARKGMESDEAEIQAVKDKFIKIRQTIENENEKIARYNKKNKDKKGFRAVGQIDVSQLDAIEQRAIDEVTYNQGTAKLEQEIEAKKKLFAEYEDYRAKLGKEKADQRYKDELAGFKSLTEYLRAKSLENQDTIDAYTNKTADAGQEERAKLLKKETDEATSEEKKKQTDVLSLMISYDQKRKNLISDYEANRAKLMKSATAEELAEFDRRHTEELNELDDSNIQKLQSVKDLFDGIERLTDTEARKVIRNIELLLASGVNISPELLKKVREALKDATKSLDSRLPERVMQTSNAFSQMAGEIGVVNEGLGNMFSVLGYILSTSVQIGKNLGELDKGLINYEKYQKDKAKGSGGGLLGGISAIAGIAGPVAGIVSSVSGIVSGVIGFFNAAKESARQAAKQMKEYQESVLAGEYEYNRLLRERAREHKGINELTVEQIRLQQELLKLQTTQAESDFKSILKRIQSEGQQITGQKTEKYGGFLGFGKKTRVVDITSGLSGYTYDQLEKLYTSNKLTEATKKLFEELKKAKEEIDGIGEAWDDMQKELLDKMSGGATADSIASTITQGLRDGKRAVVDFADSAEEIIQNALLSAMSATVLEEPLQELVKKFREDAKDGLSQNEIDEFKKAYGEVVQSGIDAMKEIDKLTGKTGSSTPTGRINAGTSEATSSAILGFERSRYDLAKQHLQAALAALDFEKKSYDQILESVRYLKAIEQNTKDTVAELKNAVVELKAINKNTTTKTGRTTEGMGL
ncbi:hypothetical protein [Sphingobacterium thalpophilum]|uniref:hypothetical protein n=1 Tax=Sphingobacterium thalpophilum TaxID=259 RepID=UPI0024A740C7|nr:hypothetical protein [Sphingobacterium thalpophilum]